MEKLKMHSMNKIDDNVKKIAELFPECITERINDNNELEKVVDIDAFKQLFSSVAVEGNQERYQFTWPDKRKARALINQTVTSTLRPCRAESVNFDTTENLYIEGDNLEVLKLLQETYLGKIKMIYIDPPYNTGNDFVYEDDFSQNVNLYTSNSGQYDNQGNRLVANTESNGRFHTDWLNMIYPRLKLARDLLTDDGVIFISIDDNEYANLFKICDEVFGAPNYLGTYIKQSKVGGGSDTKFIVKEHEYCIVYSRNINCAPEMFIEHDKEYLKRYKEQDERGRFFWDTFARPGLKNPIYYDIIAPDGTVINNGWIHGKERYEQELKEGVIRIIKKNNDDGWSVQCKQYLNLNGKKPRSMTMDFGGSIEGRKDIGNIFNNEKIFSYPKSEKFIKTLISTIEYKNGIILDFFSGSATVANAVMKLNAEDGGHRKFIMVQLPEECDEKSEAYKAGYKNICEIGKERIRRAGKQILAEKHGDLLANESELDVGFRDLKLDSSNMNDVYYTPDDTYQDMLDMMMSNIKEDRTAEDLLFQVMLDLGILLSADIKEENINGKKIYNVDFNHLIACFDEDIDEDAIVEVAKKKPTYFIMRDSSLANDAVSVNFDQIFARYSPETIRKVL